VNLYSESTPKNQPLMRCTLSRRPKMDTSNRFAHTFLQLWLHISYTYTPKDLLIATPIDMLRLHK